METIILDDEQAAINHLKRMLKRVDPDGTHTGVLTAEEFLKYIKTHNADAAFVDINLFNTDGMTITRQAAEIQPELNIIIYTGHPEYKAEALDLFVSGYLVKPVGIDDLKNVLSHLRYPLKNLYVQCFGHFEVFVNSKPMRFDRMDSKEVLAYLIDRRGAEVSDGELMNILWKEEGDSDKKKVYIRNIIYDIRCTFAKYGIENIINNHHRCYNVDVTRFRCDYYEYLEGKEVRQAMLGEYMEQFSDWSAKTKSAIFGRKR